MEPTPEVPKRAPSRVRIAASRSAKLRSGLSRRTKIAVGVSQISARWVKSATTS